MIPSTKVSPFGVLFLFLFTLPLSLLAQFPFENPIILNADNGLPSDRVLAMEEDEKGVAWIATTNGLVRFDGLTMKIFQSNPDDSTSLLTHGIQAILPDGENGKVWLATNRGLSVLDQKTNRFKNYVHDPSKPNSVPDHKIMSIFKDRDDQIWMGIYERGIARFRPDTDDFEQYICQGDLLSGKPCLLSASNFAADLENDSILWLAGNGITRFNRINSSFENFMFETDDMAVFRYANSPTSMLIRPNGKIYYGTWYNGVYVMDTKTLSISQLQPEYRNGTFAYEMGRDLIIGFFPINEHQFWINSWKGAQLYDTRTNSIIQAYNSSRIEQTSYGFDHIDKMGRIWHYSNDDGIRIYNPLMQQYELLQYDDKDSPYHSHTRRILEDTIRKRIYVAASGSTQGLHYFDQIKKDWHFILPPKGKRVGELEGMNIVDIALLDNGHIIVLSDSIYWYEPGFKRLKKYPVQPKEEVIRFRACMVDSEGFVWLGAWTGGFYRLNHETKELHSFREDLDSFSEKNLGGDHMAEDIHGNIWMRENFSLLIWERSTGKFIHHPYDPENLKSLRGMGRMTATEDGRVWVACNSEFLAYGHADSLDRGIIRYLGRKEGLVGSHVYLAKKHRERLLVFTDKGMQFFDPRTMRFGKFFDYGYGLENNVYNATWLKDGRLAVGSQKAIALFYPDSLRTNEELPIPYITFFRVFDNIYDLDTRPGRMDSIDLNYTQNFFSFEFSAVGYNLPGKTRFRYMLEGFDEKWQDGTQRRFAAYTNVPGGQYTFKVEAINNEGLSLEQPHSLFLDISTVWYKTVWFWCLALVSLAILGYLIYRWRIAQVRKEERLRSDYERQLASVEMSALRAQMNPHFIFNSLNSIEYYIITNESEKAVDYLGRFSKLIRLILQNSKSTIVPLKDDLEALKLYIEMESLRFDNLFDYEVKMESNIDPERVVVPPLLLQPYVENAIWHGLMQKRDGKGKLDLTLRRSNGHLICSIEDNGIGRQAAQNLKSKSATQRKSYGMKITSDRLAMLNKLAGADASVNIYDLKNAEGNATGTRVELIIPL